MKAIDVARVSGEEAWRGIPAGDMAATSPAVSNRTPDFPVPHAFIPTQFDTPRRQDLVNRRTYIPFGTGRHRRVEAAMAEFSVLLRDYDFEMVPPSESCPNDHTKMVDAIEQPVRVRCTRRAGST